MSIFVNLRHMMFFSFLCTCGMAEKWMRFSGIHYQWERNGLSSIKAVSPIQKAGHSPTSTGIVLYRTAEASLFFSREEIDVFIGNVHGNQAQVCGTPNKSTRADDVHF